ncbi:MAG: hypothetical protein IPG39_11840 [Bacteroidetes bacterium]|nr:hypothetical protein [Bacteroidota bacterium]
MNAQWYQQISGTEDDLTSVYFTDYYTGYVVGYNGTILKTTDAGFTWNAQASLTASNLLYVYFSTRHRLCSWI